ncbi:hypothetical protein H6G41_16380 [Tolypothrix sp. FACHB-123]|uniref:hypothetical protein n=1 Tax=Tolypothrix sp. FACHB-123 TaxID=2692868 RepID=UPI0016889D25|nr:hypothetical protein [Tolypothrix sp. FACHB-123]MBD2356183.1 hypothetical protein [Tolypothrix sp. FACHB-123]
MLQYTEKPCFVCKKMIRYRMEVEMTASGTSKIYWQPIAGTPDQPDINKCPICRCQVSRIFGYSLKASLGLT